MCVSAPARCYWSLNHGRGGATKGLGAESMPVRECAQPEALSQRRAERGGALVAVISGLSEPERLARARAQRRCA